jgi:ANTAR domain-containing protein/GAF domain-containing protein
MQTRRVRSLDRVEGCKVVAETHEGLIGRLAAVLASLNTVESVSSRLCEAGRQMLDADGAAMTLMTSSESLVVVAATNDLAAQLEDLQEVVGEGPSKDAFRDNAVQFVDFATPEEDRWSLMHEHGGGLGFTGTMIALPLRPRGEVIGTLTAHRESGAVVSDPATSDFLAVAIGTAVLQDPGLGTAEEAHTDPWAARAQIHQATGMIISQLGVRAEDALALLRGQAFANNTTLLEVARQIVERRINFRNFTIEGD